MPTLAEIRNRTGASGSATESFLLTARASLKHTAPPIEAPINPVVYGGRTKRTGRPTVNVPTEKMASFLNEVKSAKLKKISNHFAPPLRPAPEEVGNVSLSSGMRRDILRDIARRKSLATLRPEPTTGEKWKRGVTGDSDLVESGEHLIENERRPKVDFGCDIAARAKRKPQDRPTSFLSPDSSASSFASTSSNVPFDRRSISNTNAAYNRTWPSITTDFTTPSLTSDNENDHEGENSPSNRLPATPPILEEPAQPESVTLSQSQTIAHAQQGTSDKDRQLQPPIITSSLLDDPLPELSSSPPRSPTPSPPEIEVLQPQPRLPSSRSSRNAFAKRVPSSPMPSTTPKKPLPPARKRPKSRIIIDSEDEGVGNEEVEEDQQDEEPLTMPLFDPTFPSQTKRELRSAPEPDAIPALAKPVPTRIPKKRAAGNTSSLKRKATSSDLRAQSNGANSSKGLNGSTASTSSRSSKSNLPRPAPSTSNHAKRRKTLDEEIRKAGDILWSEGDSGGNHGHDEDEAEEDGVLTGVGMKSKKKGFLAGGGAGGAPVFMGPGYVEGAEDDRMRGGNEFAFPIEDMDEDEFRDEGFRKSVRRTNSRNKGKARLRV